MVDFRTATMFLVIGEHNELQIDVGDNPSLRIALLALLIQHADSTTVERLVSHLPATEPGDQNLFDILLKQLVRAHCRNPSPPKRDPGPSSAKKSVIPSPTIVKKWWSVDDRDGAGDHWQVVSQWYRTRWALTWGKSQALVRARLNPSVVFAMTREELWGIKGIGNVAAARIIRNRFHKPPPAFFNETVTATQRGP